MKLIVAEVVMEWVASELPHQRFGEILPKPEGCSWYPDARVFVKTREGTPRWLHRCGTIRWDEFLNW